MFSIRQQIYKILLHPMLYRSDLPKRQATFYLEFHQTEATQDCRTSCSSPPRITRYEPETDETRKERARKKAIHLQLDALHPRRASRFSLKPNPRCVEPGKTLTYKGPVDVLYCDWLRQFANTSTVLRGELGAVLWARSCIVVLPDSDYRQLLCCLDERPAIWKGIKCISLSPQIDFDSSVYAEQGQFSDFCDLLRRSCTPDVVSVWLMPKLEKETAKEFLKELEDGIGRFASLKHLRSVQIIKRCLVGVFLRIKREYKIDKQELESMQQYYTGRVHKIMTPDSLRPEKSAEALYLANRLQ